MKYQTFIGKFVSRIVDRPWQTLGFFSVFSILMILGLLKFKSQYSPRIWYHKDHSAIKLLNAFENRFGSDQTVGIGVYSKNGIFTKEALASVYEMSDQLWEVKDVVRVESLTNYNLIDSIEDEIQITPFIEGDIPESEEGLQSLKKKALGDKGIQEFFISKDLQYAVIYGFLKPAIEKDPDFPGIIDGVRKIVAENKIKYPELDFHIVGEAAGNNAFREISMGDNQKIIPFMIFFIFVLLFIMFRNIWVMIVPIVLVGATTVVTFGLMGHIGLTFTSLLSAVPGILLAICIADAIHIFTTYFHFRRLGDLSKVALEKSMAKNFQPTLLTTISTAISFISITLTDIKPIQSLGILAAFGTFVAWGFSYILIGALFSLLTKNLDKHKVKKGKEKEFKSTNYVNWLDHHKKKVIVIFSLITVVCGYIASKNEVNSDPIKYFDESVEARVSYEFTNKKMDGIKGAEFFVDTLEKGGVKNPEFLRLFDKYQDTILKEDKVMRVKSLLDVFKKMNKILNGNKDEFYAIPDSQKSVAEILFLYTMSLPSGMDINNQLSVDERYLRFRVVWNLETSKEIEEKIGDLVRIGKDMGLKINPGGVVPLYSSMNSKIVESFISSMLLALVLVSILLYFVFNDIFISFLSMLPNTVPLIIGAAVMKGMGRYIDIGTSMVYTVCLGIAVDDTIHFISSYKTNRKLGLTSKMSIEETLNITGRALVVTSVILVIGFGSFIFADFVPNSSFGILCSIILAIALLTDIIFLPALLLLVDRNKD